MLLVLAIVIIKKQKDGELNLDFTNVVERITGDESVDSNTEESEETTEDDEEEWQELMSAEVAQSLVQTKEDGTYAQDEAYTSGDIKVNQTAVFSGQFVEDGRDELVENVAAIQITNSSNKYLELATLLYEINGQTATFVVTGIPAGKTAWVMEKSRMVVTSSAEFQYLASTTSFRNDIVSSSQMIDIAADGNMMTATNKSESDMENIVVYYKVKHDDGNYFGGITYVVDFGQVKAGESAETLAGHYKKGQAEIVRIDWAEK